MTSKTFTLNNPGTIPVTIQSINFRDPPDIGHVADLSNLGGSASVTGNATLSYVLGVGASQTFAIDYNSTTAPAGTYEGRVMIAGSDRASTVITSTIVISAASTTTPAPTTPVPATTTTTTTTTTAPPTNHISGFMSEADPYAAKSGFSLDNIGGSIWLTAGMYPASFAGSSWHANDGVAWELLKFKGTGTNQLSNDNTSNVYQLTNNLYDRWGMMDSVNISAISIGSSANLNHSTYSISVYGAGWPFNVTVKPTYVVRRTGTNTATIELGADDPVTDYNISDTGNAITIRNWFARTNLLFGGTNEETGLDAYGNPIITVPFSRGVRTLTW